MRMLGAAMICLACLSYCLGFERGQRARRRELSSAAAMLEQMGAELEARLTPLPELARLLANETEEPASGFLVLLG